MRGPSTHVPGQDCHVSTRTGQTYTTWAEGTEDQAGVELLKLTRYWSRVATIRGPVACDGTVDHYDLFTFHLCVDMAGWAHLIFRCSPQMNTLGSRTCHAENQRLGACGTARCVEGCNDFPGGTATSAPTEKNAWFLPTGTRVQDDGAIFLFCTT